VTTGKAGETPIDRDAISPGAWPMVAVLTGCYLVSMLDRFVVNLLIQPMAASLHLSDVQISLLVGFAFTLFYATAGIMMGSVVDRYDRRLVIIIGILTWTAATAATGLATSYTSLLIARIIVGAGEAALAPSAYSLIAEAFPRHKLSRPTSIYFLGGAIGPGVSLVLGAFALRWAEELNSAHLLSALGNEPWRLVLLLAAVPGVFAAAAVAAFVRDRRSTHVERNTAPSETSLWKELASKPLLYLGLLGGTAAVSVYINGLAAWWPTHALRNFGWPLKDGGVYFGIALAIGTVAGLTLSGSIGTALMRRFGDAGNGIGLFTLSIIATPVLILAPFIAAPIWQLISIGAALAVAFAVNGLAPVGFQLAAGPSVRGRVSAFYVASTTIIGAGFGPVAVAALGSINVYRNPLGLSWAFSIVGLICGILMTAAYGLYLRSIRLQKKR
jgi:MFS family permease